MSTTSRKEPADDTGSRAEADPDSESSGDADEREPVPALAAPYRISRAALVLIACALGLGLLIGRASVTSDPAASAPTPTPAATPTRSAVAAAPGAGTLALTGARCAVDQGRTLLLAVEVRNADAAPIVFKRLSVITPKGGLTVVSAGGGACGELDPVPLVDSGIPAGGSRWLSAVVRPDVACPATRSVLMRVAVTDLSGRAAIVPVDGFPTLAAVPWPGCPRP